MPNKPGRFARNGVRAAVAQTIDPGEPTPQRAVITRSPQRNVGAVPLPWIQEESVHHESHLEHCCIYALMLFGGLKRVVHQGACLESPDGTPYRPDFHVEFIDSSLLVLEAKPTVFVAKNKPKFDTATAQLRKKNTTFAVLTDKHLLNSCFESLGPLAHRYAKDELPNGTLEPVLRAARQHGDDCLLEDLIVEADPMSRIPVYHLIGRGLLRTIPESWAGDTSPLRIPTHRPQGDLDVAHLFLAWTGARPWTTAVEISPGT